MVVAEASRRNLNGSQRVIRFEPVLNGVRTLALEETGSRASV